jgi:hypothetical protein
MGYSLTSDTIPQTRSGNGHYTIKPRLNRADRRFDGRGAGRPGSGVSDASPIPPSWCKPQVTVPNILDAIGRSNMIDSPGLIENQHQLVLSLVSGQTRRRKRSATSWSGPRRPARPSASATWQRRTLR